MPRIDLLTAQMRQRSVKRVSIRAGERIQLFDDQDRLLGAGAALSGDTVGEILGQIAPSPLDGVPVAFPYCGRDGEFEILVAPGAQSFEMRALSFAAPSPLQSQSAPLTQTSAFSTPQTPAIQNAPVMPSPAAPVPVAPVPSSVEWFYLRGTEQIGDNSPAQIGALIAQGHIAPDTQMWCSGMAGWLPASQTEFKSLLPTSAGTDFFGNPLPPAGAPMTGLAPLSSPIGGPVSGVRTYGNGPYNIYGQGADPNTSGTGWDAEVPREARGWFNVGAFLFPVLWCRSHNLDQWAGGIFALNIASRYIPYIGFIKIPVCFGLGFMGNRVAWQMRRFDDVADFKKCQFLWGVWSAAASVVLWGAIILFFAAIFGISHGGLAPRSPSLRPPTSSQFDGGRSFGSGSSVESGQSSGSDSSPGTGQFSGAR